MKILTLVALIFFAVVALIPGYAPIGTVLGVVSAVLTIIQYMREPQQDDKKRKQKKRLFEVAVKIRF